MEEITSQDRERQLNLRRPLSDFALSVRTNNILRMRNIRFIMDLAACAEEEVREWSDRGMRAFRELSGLLNDLGLRFGMKRLNIDIMEVAAAMESDRSMSEYCLDTETGDVVIVPDDLSRAVSFGEVDENSMTEWELELLPVARALESGSSRYVCIPEVEAREIYELMQRFASDREDEELQRLLWVALDGKGAFGRFRRVLDDYPEERDEWYRRKDESMRILAHQWLSTLDIEATSNRKYDS